MLKFRLTNGKVLDLTLLKHQQQLAAAVFKYKLFGVSPGKRLSKENREICPEIDYGMTYIEDNFYILESIGSLLYKDKPIERDSYEYALCKIGLMYIVNEGIKVIPLITHDYIFNTQDEMVQAPQFNPCRTHLVSAIWFETQKCTSGYIFQYADGTHNIKFNPSPPKPVHISQCTQVQIRTPSKRR